MFGHFIYFLLGDSCLQTLQAHKLDTRIPFTQTERSHWSEKDQYQRLENYFIANDIDNVPKRRAILFNV